MLADWRVGFALSSKRVCNDRHPKVGSAAVVALDGPLETGYLAAGRIQTDSKSLDFAVPSVHARLGDAVLKILGNLDQAASLLRVNTQHGATNTRMLMFTGAAIRASAGAEFEFAKLKCC